jgi:hypothetical protein
MAGALIAAAAAATLALPDSALPNTTEVAWSPERSGLYLGSPSITACGGALLASHDFFGGAQGTAYIHASRDGGDSWTRVGSVAPMYWATLFVGADGALYALGTSSDTYASRAAAAREA